MIMKDYKVETKPTYWHVKISSGAYSDYCEEHIFFAGNSKEEIWHFLVRYIESRNYIYQNPMLWNEEKFIPKNYFGDKNVDWSSSYDIDNVIIKRLDIIHFKK